jgi:hypothetical protein
MIQSVQELINIAAHSVRDALITIEKESHQIIPLFQSAEEIILLAESEGKYDPTIGQLASEKIITFHLISKDFAYFATLLNNSDTIIKLASLNENIVSQLLYHQPLKIMPLFKKPDDIFRLACVSDMCVTDILSHAVDLKSELFKTATINHTLFEYAMKQSRHHIIYLLLRFMPKENIDKNELAKLLEVMQENPTIDKKDILELRSYFNNTTINQPATFFSDSKKVIANLIPDFVKNVFGYN